MRIHVVTPKAPVHVTLSPKVQPAPAPCPLFVPGITSLPGNEETVKLSQSAYWVLRLPYPFESSTNHKILRRVAVISAKNHKRQRRKRQTRKVANTKGLNRNTNLT